MTEEELVEIIKRRLAPPPLVMELSDTVIMDCITFAKQWYAANAGRRAMIRLNIIQGQVEYQLTNDILDVTAVNFTADQLPEVAWDWDYVALSGSPMSFAFVWPWSMDYSCLVQMMQRLEEAKRITGIESAWRYRQQDRILELYPASHQSNVAVAEVISSNVDLSTMPYDEQWLLERWAIADTKEVLGRLRSKHSGMPGPGGDQTLDGDKLLEEAAAEKERLQEELRGRRLPVGFITG